jgi:hypothetical protein
VHADALRLCLAQRIDGARVVHVRPIAQDLNSDIHLTLLSDIPLEVYPSSFFEAVLFFCAPSSAAASTFESFRPRPSDTLVAWHPTGGQPHADRLSGGARVLRDHPRHQRPACIDANRGPRRHGDAVSRAVNALSDARRIRLPEHTWLVPREFAEMTRVGPRAETRGARVSLLTSALSQEFTNLVDRVVLTTAQLKSAM